jgi:hypothetical protein
VLTSPCITCGPGGRILLRVVVLNGASRAANSDLCAVERNGIDDRRGVCRKKPARAIEAILFTFETAL